MNPKETTSISKESEDTGTSALSVCGTDCHSCYCYGKMCTGCDECEGKVFHAPEGSVCTIYDCVRNEKGLPDCGSCDELPCGIWMSTRDPHFSEEEFKQNVAERVRALRENGKNP